MILGAPSIREVIAFPKNRSAFCPLTEAPSAVATDQLQELGLLDLEKSEGIAGIHQKRDTLDELSWVARIGIDEDVRTVLTDAVDEASRLAEAINAEAKNETPLYTHVHAVNRMRDKSDARPSDQAKTGTIFKNAPAVKGNYFKVAAVLES
jgi:aspartyl-tRNA synthetase